MFSFYHLEVTISDPRRATLESSIYRISFFTNFTKHFHQKPVFSGQLTDEERRRPVVDDPSVISHFTTFLLVVVQCLCVCVCVCLAVAVAIASIFVELPSLAKAELPEFRTGKKTTAQAKLSITARSDRMCLCAGMCAWVFCCDFFLLASTVFSDGFTGFLMGFIIHHRSGVGI